MVVQLFEYYKFYSPLGLVCATPSNMRATDGSTSQQRSQSRLSRKQDQCHLSTATVSGQYTDIPPLVYSFFLYSGMLQYCN